MPPTVSKVFKRAAAKSQAMAARMAGADGPPSPSAGGKRGPGVAADGAAARTRSPSAPTSPSDRKGSSVRASSQKSNPGSRVRSASSKSAVAARGASFTDERSVGGGAARRAPSAGARSTSPGRAGRSATDPEGWFRTPTDRYDARQRAQSENRARQSGAPGGGYRGRAPRQEAAAAARGKSEGGDGTVLVRNPSTGQLQAVPRSRASTPAPATGLGRKSVEMAARSDERLRGLAAQSRCDFVDERRKLGGHYEWMCADLFDNYKSDECKDHDAMLADTITKLRPTDAPHPLLSEPRPPMNAAFTDRAARLREGRAAKGVLDHSDKHKATDWFTHGECFCEVCQPSTAKAAGCASHEVSYHKLCPAAQDHHPVSPDGKMHDNLNSDGVAAAITHQAGKTGYSEEDDRPLRQSMHSKIKASPATVHRRTLEPGQATVMLPHRTVCDVPAAGQFNQDYRPEIGLGSNKGRQIFQGARSISPTPTRSGAALCLSPREDDPPPPTKITHCRRGPGQCKEPSANAEGLAIYHNQETLRFADPAVPRGRAGPAPDLEGLAGKSSKAQAAAAERQHRAGSPNPLRAQTNNNSAVMTVLMDSEVHKAWHKSEREERLKTEKPFSDLCTTASEHLQTQRSLMTTVKSMNGHHTKLDLSWAGAEE